MSRSLRFFVVLCLFAGMNPASYGSDFYAELSGDVVVQTVAEERFRPGAADLRLGFYLMQQIGLEVFGGAGVSDDSNAGLTQTIKTRYGLSTRFESPSRDGTKAFILLGYANHDLELSRESNGQTLVEEEFDGFAYGVGLEQQLFNKESRWFINARWQRFYSAGDVDIDALGVALRWVY